MCDFQVFWAALFAALSGWLTDLFATLFGTGA